MKFFSIQELCRSNTAVRLGINNSPSELIRTNLEALVERVLDPLRAAWGAPIIVTSGYRCPALNKAVGGAASSQHMKGMAADIHTLSDSRADNMRLLRLLLNSGIIVDQVIAENVDAQHRPDWIHVSYNRITNRRSLLTATKFNGKWVYSQGIRTR